MLQLGHTKGGSAHLKLSASPKLLKLKRRAQRPNNRIVIG